MHNMSSLYNSNMHQTSQNADRTSIVPKYVTLPEKSRIFNEGLNSSKLSSYLDRSEEQFLVGIDPDSEILKKGTVKNTKKSGMKEQVSSRGTLKSQHSVAKEQDSRGTLKSQHSVLKEQDSSRGRLDSQESSQYNALLNSHF